MSEQATESYTPRVGDLVESRHGVGTAKVARVEGDRIAVTWDAFGAADPNLYSADGFAPLRPTAAGQRVRYWERFGWAMGIVDDDPTRTRVQFDGDAFWSAMPTADLVRVAATTNPLPVTSTTAEELGREMGRALTTGGQHEEAKRAWAVGPASPPSQALSPIAQRHAGHCPTCDRATRAKGEVRVYVWACGCPVEPEQVESNAEIAGSPRDVVVWGGAAVGAGWTHDEALAAWRTDLAVSQECVDGGVPATSMAHVGYVLDGLHGRKRQREEASAKDVHSDTIGCVHTYAKLTADLAAYRYPPPEPDPAACRAHLREDARRRAVRRYGR